MALIGLLRVKPTFAYGVQSLLRTLRGLTLFVSIHDIENTFSSLSAFSVGLD